MRPWRTYNCVDCGTACHRKRDPAQSLVCAACGEVRATRQALHTHNEAVQRAAERAARRSSRRTAAA